MQRTHSPDTSDHGIEQELVAKGKTAPRITSADIEAEIASEHYFTAAHGAYAAQHDVGFFANAELRHVMQQEPVHESLSLLTFCVLVLRNGFTVTGESACASPENFDAEIGRKIARAKAIDKMWALLGFRLRDRIVRGEFDASVTGVVFGVDMGSPEGDRTVEVVVRPDYQQRVIDEKAELDERLAKLEAFFFSKTFANLPEQEAASLSDQAHFMRSYSESLAKRISWF